MIRHKKLQKSICRDILFNQWKLQPQYQESRPSVIILSVPFFDYYLFFIELLCRLINSELAVKCKVNAMHSTRNFGLKLSILFERVANLVQIHYKIESLQKYRMIASKQQCSSQWKLQRSSQWFLKHQTLFKIFFSLINNLITVIKTIDRSLPFLILKHSSNFKSHHMSSSSCKVTKSLWSIFFLV